MSRSRRPPASPSGDADERTSSASGGRRVAWWLAGVALVVLVLYASIGFAVTTFLIGNHARWRGSGGDWLVPTADARRLQKALSGTRSSLVVIPGAAHDRTYSAAPEVYGASVLSFLAGALPGAAAGRAAPGGGER